MLQYCHISYKSLLLLLVTGGSDFDYIQNNDVLEFDVDEEVWTKIGTMSVQRSAHAVSVINYLAIEEYCTF